MKNTWRLSCMTLQNECHPPILKKQLCLLCNAMTFVHLSRKACLKSQAQPLSTFSDSKLDPVLEPHANDEEKEEEEAEAEAEEEGEGEGRKGGGGELQSDRNKKRSIQHETLNFSCNEANLVGIFSWGCRNYQCPSGSVTPHSCSQGHHPAMQALPAIHQPLLHLALPPRRSQLASFKDFKFRIEDLFPNPDPNSDQSLESRQCCTARQESWIRDTILCIKFLKLNCEFDLLIRSSCRMST